MALNLTDVVLLILLLVSFVLGYFQGTIRQLLGIAAWLVAFLISASLSHGVGDWLSRYWTQLPVGYSAMIAFLLVFVFLMVVFNILMTMFYKRTPIHSRLTVLDEIIGGFLGAGLYLLILATILIILDSVYGRGAVGATDVRWMRDLHRVLIESNVGRFLLESLIPGLLAIFGPILPSEVRDVGNR
jgi:membrane protein required for colicin V production